MASLSGSAAADCLKVSSDRAYVSASWGLSSLVCLVDSLSMALAADCSHWAFAAERMFRVPTVLGRQMSSGLRRSQLSKTLPSVPTRTSLAVDWQPLHSPGLRSNYRPTTTFARGASTQIEFQPLPGQIPNDVFSRICFLVPSLSGNALNSSRFFLMSGTPGPGQSVPNSVLDAISSIRGK
jgi:hypothetical protein